MPLVMDLHGYLETASFAHLGTGLGPYGDSQGFVTITPQMTESGPGRWDYGPNSADIRYLGSLLSHVEGSLCIDERRVFATGLSMGALTSSAIACELSGRVAAVAPVAGVQAYPWCRPSRPVPVVAFHGTADPFISFNGGPGPEALKLPALDNPNETIGQEIAANPQHANPQISGILPQSIPTQVANWAKRNGCRPRPTTTHIAADVNRVTYPCPADALVVFYMVLGGGHSWPGSTSGAYPAAVVGPTTHSISANQVMWAFFQTHPLQHVG